MCHLHRTERWHGLHSALPPNLRFADIVALLLPELSPFIIHLRSFVYSGDRLASLSIFVSSKELWDRHAVCEVCLSSWLCSPECSAFSEGVGWPPVPERGWGACKAGTNKGLGGGVAEGLSGGRNQKKTVNCLFCMPGFRSFTMRRYW